MRHLTLTAVAAAAVLVVGAASPPPARCGDSSARHRVPASRGAVLPAARDPGPPRDEDLSPDGTPLRLVLALDGIPFDLFAEAQESGLFAGFRPAARMVSTFPSLSDVAFSAIGGDDPPDGYQVMRFDRESNRVVGTTLASLAGKAHAHLPIDSRSHSSFHRMIGYVASYHTALRELRGIGKDVLRSPKATFVGYVEATDAMMHVHGRRKAERFLVRLDASIGRLQADVRARTGRDLAIDLVSDHGSTLVHGRRVSVHEELAACGFCRSGRLDSPDQVAYSFAGIIGSVAIACAPERAPDVASCLARRPDVDLVAFARGDAVVVVSAMGEAEVRLAAPGGEEAYAYRMLTGDALGLGPMLGVADEAPRPAEVVVEEARLFDLTVDGERPDPLRRVWRAFHGAVKQPAEVLVSLADGYEAGNGAVRFLASIRGRAGTHGSLTRMASLGVLASNWRDVSDTDAWRARDVLFGEPARTAMRARGARPADGLAAARASEAAAAGQ